jgi:hypothetical protein
VNKAGFEFGFRGGYSAVEQAVRSERGACMAPPSMINETGAAVKSPPVAGPLFWGTFGQVLVAAAGPMGPPVAGAALILTFT